jgi:hypothetical protein
MSFIAHLTRVPGETLNLSRTTLYQAVLSTLLCGSFAPSVHAQDSAPDAPPEAPVELPPPPKIRLVLGFGATFGGDTLGTLIFTDGRSESVRAGQLLQMYGGVRYQATPRLSVQGTFGYHVDDTTASNAQIKFSRFPLELLLHHHINDQWLIGGGVRLVYGAETSATGLRPVTFDNTVGTVIEGEYLSSPTLGVKLRYVSEKYKAQAPFSGTVDGSHIGLLMNWYL